MVENVVIKRGELNDIINAAVAAAVAASSAQLSEDLNALVQANQDRLEASIDDLKKECDVRDERITGLELENNVMQEKLTGLSDVVDNLRGELRDVRKSSDATKKRCNDVEQWTRKSAIRVFGIARKERENCTKLVHSVIVEKLKMKDIPISAIEVAHRVGQSRNGKSPAIIVKFLRRDVRDAVLRARRALKGSGVSISEDLTYDNQRLLGEVKTHEDIDNAWSWNGKIFAKIATNDKIVTFKAGDDIGMVIRRESAADPPRR